MATPVYSNGRFPYSGALYCSTNCAIDVDGHTIFDHNSGSLGGGEDRPQLCCALTVLRRYVTRVIAYRIQMQPDERSCPRMAYGGNIADYWVTI